jgi:flagellar motor protein MotB
MVSYADMITIMMAFFVVLYAGTSSSGSHDKGGKDGAEAKGGKEATYGKQLVQEIPDFDADTTDERVQKVLASLYKRFGPEWTVSNCWSGGPSRHRSKPQEDATESPRPASHIPMGQAKESSTVIYANKPNETVVAGGQLFFNDDSATLDDDQKKQLHSVAEVLAGKLQKIEIRGYTSRRSFSPSSPFHDPEDLAYARSRAVSQCMVAAGIDAQRIRLGIAADTELVEAQGDSHGFKRGSRVEVRLLNEWVKALTAGDTESKPATHSPPHK